MASSNDFEKIWESYQEVVKTKDISIVDYCQRNGIVYSQFLRWYKKHAFGKSSLKKHKRAEAKKSREEENEDYDGNHDKGVQASANKDEQIDQTKVKSEHLDGERAKRENYTKMNAARVTELLCDTSNIPAGMRLIGFKEINEFDKISYIKAKMSQTP